MNKISVKSAYVIGIWGSFLAFFGTLFSGPVSVLLITLLNPQPPWESAAVFAANYSYIQSIPFYFGYFLVLGSLCMFTAIYILSEDKTKSLLGLIFASIGCGLIFLNYLTQNTFIPALVKNFMDAYGPIISTFSMSNPLSLAWALEMWGYGLLGLGTWLVSSFFQQTFVERTAKILFILNGILSIIGAFWTSFDLAWVYEIEGLFSYLIWNILYILLAVFFYLALRQRRSGLQEISEK